MKKTTLLFLLMIHIFINKSLGQEVESTSITKMDSMIIMLAKKDYVKELRYFDKKKFLPVWQCGNIVIETIYAYSVKDKGKDKSINVLLINLYHKDSRAKIFFSYPDIIDSNWKAVEYVQKEGQKNEYYQVSNAGEIEVKEENRKYVMFCLKKLLKLND